MTHTTAEGAASHLWIVPTSASGEKARQLTFSPPADKRGEHSAQWAPDNSAIFFLAKRGEQTQLFRLDLRGGEASPYDLKILPPVDASKEKDAINPPPPATAPAGEKKDDKKSADQKTELQPIDVAGFSVSEDGKYLAIWAHDPETPGEKKQKEAKIDASWVNHETHATRLYLASLKPDGSIDGALKSVAVPPDVHGAVMVSASPTSFSLSQKHPTNSPISAPQAPPGSSRPPPPTSRRKSPPFPPRFKVAHGTPTAPPSSSPPPHLKTRLPATTSFMRSPCPTRP